MFDFTHIEGKPQGTLLIPRVIFFYSLGSIYLSAEGSIFIHQDPNLSTRFNIYSLEPYLSTWIQIYPLGYMFIHQARYLSTRLHFYPQGSIFIQQAPYLSSRLQIFPPVLFLSVRLHIFIHWLHIYPLGSIFIPWATYVFTRLDIYPLGSIFIHQTQYLSTRLHMYPLGFIFIH